MWASCSALIKKFRINVPTVRWAENIACMCKTKTLYILSVKPEGSGLLRRPRLRMEDNIKMDQMAMGQYGIMCCVLVQR